MKYQRIMLFAFLRVKPDKKQQKRKVVGFSALFLIKLLLNSLSTTQGKIAMEGNFSHIAPWTALYDDPAATNNLPRLFSKSFIKNTAENPTTFLFCVPFPISYLFKATTTLLKGSSPSLCVTTYLSFCNAECIILLS